MSDLEKLLRSSLQKVGGEYHPTDPVAARERFLAARRRRRFYAFGEFAAATSMAALAVFFIARADIGPTEGIDVVARAPKVVAEIETMRSPVAVAAGEGAVWMTSNDGQGLTKIDPITDEKLGEAQIDGQADEVVVGNGAVWVSDTDGSIYRVNPDDPTDVTTVREGPGDGSTRLDLAIGSTALWVVDPSAGAVFTAGDEVGFSQDFGADTVTDVAAGTEGVWAYMPSGSLVQIDGAQDTLDAPEGDRNSDLQVGFGAAWVATGAAGEVHRVDLDSGETTHTADVGGNYTDLTVSVDDESVWALAIDDRRSILYELDPDSGEIVSEPLRLDGKATDVSAGEGSLWVPDDTGKVSKIAPEADAEPSPEPSQSPPSDPGFAAPTFVYVHDGDLWAASPLDYVALTNTEADESDPQLAGDNRLVVFQRDTGRGPEIVTMDVESGIETDSRPGSLPALGVDERLAWVATPEEASAQGIEGPAIALSTVEGDEVVFAPAFTEDLAAMGVGDILDVAWHPNGETLILDVAFDGGRSVWLADVEFDLEGRPLGMSPAEVYLPDETNSDGRRFLAPSGGPDGPGVVLGCCFVSDGDQLSEFEFGTLDIETREFSGFATLDGVEDPFALWSAYIGETDASAGDDALILSGAPGPATWLVGDGVSVWIVRADGNIDRLALPWSGAGSAAGARVPMDVTIRAEDEDPDT